MSLQTRTSRKSLALVITGLVLASGTISGLLAANAQSNDELLVWGDATRQPAVEAYQKAHPDVKVRFVAVDLTENPTKMRLFNKAGSGWPDVLFDNFINVPQLVSSEIDYALDLKPVVPADVVAKFSKGSLGPCTYGKRLVCLRNDIAQNVIWYNTKLMKDFGYTMPKTWEDYTALGLQVAKEHPGYITGVVGSGSEMYQYFWASRCEVTHTIGENTLRVNLTSEKCTRVATMLDQMLAAGAIPKFGPFDAGFNKIGEDGKMLMVVGPAWYGEYIMKPNLKIPAGQLSVAPPLKWKNETKAWTGSYGGAMWLVSKHSTNAKTAVDLATWVTTSDGYQKDAPGYPAYAPAAANWAKKIVADKYYANDITGVLKQAADLIDPTFTFPRFDSVGLYTNIIDSGLKAGKTYTQLLPEVEAQLTQLAKVAGYKVIK